MSEFPSNSKRIGDMTITVTKYDCFRSFALLSKLGKVFGPSLIQLGEMNLNDEIESSKIFSMIGGVLMNLDNPIPLTLEILAGTSVEKNGKLVEFRDKDIIVGVFGTDLKSMIEAVVFSLQVQYGDFIEALLSTLPGEILSKGSESPQ